MNKQNGGKEIGMVMLLGCRCRCGHEWLPREATTGRPNVCPKCKAANWDQPRRDEKPKIGRQKKGVRSSLELDLEP
jgi:predicted Zn-ribbon and HTH transcriptional regulator